MKYIKNPDGGIHSVDDDFELPQGWVELSEDEVRQDAPALLGISQEPEATPAEPVAPESAPAQQPSEAPSESQAPVQDAPVAAVAPFGDLYPAPPAAQVEEPAAQPEQPVEAPADQAAPVEPQPGGVQ